MSDAQPSSARWRWRERLREEGVDVAQLALCLFVPLTIWIVFFGVRPGVAPLGKDARQLDWPALVELARVGGDTSRWLYRATWVGGARIYELSGEDLVLRLGARLGASAVDTITLGLLASQALLGFFAVKSVEALRRSWGDAPTPLRAWEVAATSASVAFMPLVGMRVLAGHLSIVSGMLAFLAPAALLLIVRGGASPSIVTLLAAAFSVERVVSSGMQQMVLYAALFGGILLAPLFVRECRRPARLAAPALAIAAGVALALPVFAVLLASAIGPDAGRRLAGGSVVWWSIARPREWLTLFTSSLSIFAPRNDVAELHETQIPLGLALAGMLAVPWRRERALAWSMPIGLALVALLSMKVEPIASALLALVPPLRSFRVPARGIAPFALLATVLAIAALSREGDARSIGATRARATITALLATTLFVLLAVMPGAWGEATGLVAVTALALLTRARAATSTFAAASAIPRWVAPLALAVASVAATGRVLPDAVSDDALSAQLVAVRAELGEAASKHALDRVYVDEEILAGPDAFALAGMSGAFGYFFPSRHVKELYGALQGKAFGTTSHLMTPIAAPEDPGTRALAMLYDVHAWRHSQDGGHSTIALPTIGPAWFPRRWVVVDDRAALGVALRERAASPRALADDAIYGPGEGPAPTPIDPACGEGAVAVARTIDGGQRIELDVTSPGRCLLVVSTNWTSRHEATFTRRDGATISVRIVPVYGALIGLLLPQGEGRVVLEPRVEVPRWATAGRWLGALCLLAAVGARRLASARAA